MLVDPSKIMSFEDQKAWEKWLSKYYQQQEGIWLKLYKKASDIKSVNYQEALDVALCYGWIDGQVKKLDENARVQRFTPRRPRSIWSKRNTEHVARLIKAGLMKPAGLAEIERAKEDGRWEKAYESSTNTTIPEDFLKELEKNKKAKDFWEVLNKTNKFAMIWQVNDARREETRVRRINKFVEMLARGEKLY